MRAEIFQHVRQCELCQRAKPAQDARVGWHVAQPSTRPMEKLFLDFVGPLTRTRRGNCAILVILDGFSKFVWFQAVRRISSQVVQDCLEGFYFPAFGAPDMVVTDNARVFRSRQIKDLCFRWGVKHINTTPYYPQGSQAERANRNLKSALKIFHHHSQDVWDEDLPWINFAFNTATHESTKITPDKLFLGREVRSPLEARWNLSSEDSGENNSAVGRAFWDQAYANLKAARDRVARRYNAERKAHQYKPGDIVMYRKQLVSSKSRKIAGKLLLRWSEPVIVSKIVNDNNVLLVRPDTGIIVRKAHVSQLKPYTVPM